MSKDILKRQLGEIRESINHTLNIIHRLLEQASSVGDLIKALSASDKADANSEILEKLKVIKGDLDKNINDLVNSLDKLFSEYQEFIDETL